MTAALKERYKLVCSLRHHIYQTVAHMVFYYVSLYASPIIDFLLLAEAVAGWLHGCVEPWALACGVLSAIEVQRPRLLRRPGTLSAAAVMKLEKSEDVAETQACIGYITYMLLYCIYDAEAWLRLSAVTVKQAPSHVALPYHSDPEVVDLVDFVSSADSGAHLLKSERATVWSGACFTCGLFFNFRAIEIDYTIAPYHDDTFLWSVRQSVKLLRLQLEQLARRGTEVPGAVRGPPTHGHPRVRAWL